MQTIPKRYKLHASLILTAAAIATAVPHLNAEQTQESAVALAPYTVTAERLSLPADQVGSSVTILDESELRRVSFVSEALQRVRGVNVRSSGGVGAASTVSIRGTKDTQTLIMLNGVKITDASITSAAINLNTLSTENIERIEVIRGAHSTLYGSSAIGGVINIITKAPEEGSPQGIVDFSAGSYNTQSGSMSVSGSEDGLAYRAFASAYKTAGFSAQDVTVDTTQEDDGYQQQHFNGELSYTLSEKAQFDAFLDYTDKEIEYDSFTVGADDRTKLDQFIAKIGSTHKLLDEKWTLKPAFSITDTKAVNYGSATNGFLGTTYNANLDSVYVASNWLTLLGGLEYQQDYAKSIRNTANFDRERGNKSAYIQTRLSWEERLYLTAGARHDDSDDFGSEDTWRIAPSVSIYETGTRIHGNYGTGFRAPSLGEQFNTFGGFVVANPNLTAEKSEGFDIGIEQELLDGRVLTGLTYFYNDISDQISFSVAASQFRNINSVRTQGYEWFIEAELMPRLFIEANYTWLDTLDRSTGTDLGRQPNESFASNLSWEAIADKLNINLGAVYIGSRFDRGSNVTPMSSYLVFNTSTTYQLNDTVQLYGRIDNLLDKEYQVINTYNTSDRALYVGMRLSFE